MRQPEPDGADTQRAADGEAPTIASRTPALGVDVTSASADIDLVLDETRTVVAPEIRISTNSLLNAEFTKASADVSPASQLALPPGHQLQEYAIQAVLGTGGFGITYLAHDTNLQCQVAIKEYLPSGVAVRLSGQTVRPIADSDAHDYRQGLDRFLGETRVLASFRHPNIVRVTRFFEANNTAYMVMDYEEGRPLREWLKDREPPDEALLLRMFLPLLDGLAVVHEAGVLHRDIKPANIYVRAGDDSLVLLDFGAARYAGGNAERTLTSMVTPGYAPFEQYHTNGVQGPWSDIYALGGVLYWLVTGQKPQEAPSRIKTDDMPPAQVAAAGRYSKELLQAIDWALAPDENQRPRSVAELRMALTGGRRQPIFGKPEQARRLSTGASVGVAVGSLAIAGAAWFWLGDQSPPTPVLQPVEARSERVAVAPAIETKREEQKPPSAVKEAPPPVTLSPSPAKAEPRDAVHRAKPAAKAEAAHAAEKPPSRNKQTTAASAGTGVNQQATLTFDVSPGGTVFVDGKKMGSSPPLTRLAVAPGKHQVEVHGNLPPGVFYFSVDVAAEQKKHISARFSQIAP